MIANPVTPLISLMALANWIFMVVSAFWICWMARPASFTNRSRCRQIVRTARISSGGRKELRSNPYRRQPFPPGIGVGPKRRSGKRSVSTSCGRGGRSVMR